MRTKFVIHSLLFTLVVLIFSHSAIAQIGIGISVNFGPPPLPVYEQPICPADGYIWTPGYWAYDPLYGYYWVPGTWVLAPQVGYLWTPGYWGWGDGAFFFHEGYWGPHVGFYGGINYGFGYGGFGYEGGRWDHGHFAYNTYVSHVNTTVIRNTYNTRIVNNVTVNHVSYNGGEGGIAARPTDQERSYADQHHIPPVAAQTEHLQAARGNPELRASSNHGAPPIAATAKPSDFKTGIVPTKEAGGEYRASAAPPKDATELQAHKYEARPTGNADLDERNQRQQDELAAKQAQEHQQLQQQQEKEHQQAEQKNYNDQQKEQMEERHAQQTQQLEQRHASEQRQEQQRQAPQHQSPPPQHENAPKPH
jgi:hypothetical protein